MLFNVKWQKWYKIEQYLQWPTDSKSYMIHQTVPFSITLNDPHSDFEVTLLFNAEILVGTCIHPTQMCSFHCSSVTLSDLAKYSVMWSIMWSLCVRQLSFLLNIEPKMDICLSVDPSARHAAPVGCHCNADWNAGECRYLVAWTIIMHWCCVSLCGWELIYAGWHVWNSYIWWL